ncbi:hypothetical protein [Paenibacillus ihumii]|uniref:hypothetical protein n=1 Tax=Paenibacillus ihumii TaxID=687436 RepID=UPI0011DD287F|nr:hypothetical protein [Paenibacillus ihumii]
MNLSWSLLDSWLDDLGGFTTPPHFCDRSLQPPLRRRTKLWPTDRRHSTKHRKLKLRAECCLLEFACWKLPAGNSCVLEFVCWNLCAGSCLLEIMRSGICVLKAARCNLPAGSFPLGFPIMLNVMPQIGLILKKGEPRTQERQKVRLFYCKFCCSYSRCAAW